MSLNTQFYFSRIPLPVADLDIDALFVGADKGRSEYLAALEQQMVAAGLRPLFRIVGAPIRIPRGRREVGRRLPYIEILGLIARSRAIVDIAQHGQVGISLRPLEALFFSKKLITSNKAIRGLDFYHPQNVFILGEDDIGLLPQFVNSPLAPIDESTINRYDFESWLSRFLEVGVR
jgi:hypothetical protein